MKETTKSEKNSDPFVQKGESKLQTKGLPHPFFRNIEYPKLTTHRNPKDIASASRLTHPARFKLGIRKSKDYPDFPVIGVFNDKGDMSIEIEKDLNTVTTVSTVKLDEKVKAGRKEGRNVLKQLVKQYRRSTSKRY